MFCSEILSDFGKNRKREKLEKPGHFGFLRLNVGNPRRGVALRRSVGCLAPARPRCPKRHPSGTPRLSYCSRRANFWIFAPKV